MDYSRYPKNDRFYGGSEEKFGIVIDHVDCIVKFRKPSETGLMFNHVCEHLGSSIFRMLGIEAQNTVLGTYAGRDIVLMEDFVGNGSMYVPFNEVGDSSLENDKETYQYSYEDIMRMLYENTKLTNVQETVSTFWEMYIIDAMTGNFDRHGANWGFIKRANRYTIAPIFDNGSCLFPRINTDEKCQTILNDEIEMEKRIFRFPTSQIKLNGAKSSYFDVINCLAYPECNEALEYVIKRIDMNAIEQLIESIQMISVTQKYFYRMVLHERYNKILYASYRKWRG